MTHATLMDFLNPMKCCLATKFPFHHMCRTCPCTHTPDVVRTEPHAPQGSTVCTVVGDHICFGVFEEIRLIKRLKK